MTIEENKAIIRRYIDALNRRNEAILEELVASEFRETVRQGYLRNITAFPDYYVEIQDILAEGDQVAVEWTFRGVHRGVFHSLPATGKAISGTAISIYHLKNGQIISARGVWDQGGLWQQLGICPDTATMFNAERST